MTSKLRNFFILPGMVISLMGLSLTGCSDFLKGKPKKDDFIEVKKENLSCLKGLSTKIKNLVKPGATESDVDDSFTCIDKILTEFQSRVEGTTDANSFTKNDLYQIFDKFLNDAQISMEATSDILRLKAALLGGSDQILTKAEISSLKEFLVLIKVEVKNILPYGPILNFKKGNKEFSKNKIEQAFTQVSLSLKSLSAASSLYHSDYRFEDLKKLLLNLKITSDDQADLVELASNINDVLTGEEILKTETDYGSYISSFAEVLKLYSLNQQGYATFEVSNAESMANLVEFVEGWVHVLENSIQYKKTKLISVETLDPLILKIADKGILPVQITPKTLCEIYKVILVRVFDVGPTGDVSTFAGINKTHLVNLKKEIAVYKSYLKFINSLALPPSDSKNPNGGVEISAVQAQLKAFPLEGIAKTLLEFDRDSQIQILTAFNELRYEFLQARPVVYRTGKMVIAANQDIWKQNWNDLVRGHYTKMLGRELMLGWGTNTTGRTTLAATISEAGLAKWYGEFKNFGIEVKLFDRRTANAGPKSFKEANLFTYSADGDDKMNYLETIQYVNILTSGGGITLNEIRLGLAKAGCNLTDANDVFDFPWNSESCVIEDLKKNFKGYFSNLSYLSAYVEKLTDQQRQQFFASILDVARTDKVNKGQRVETADIRNLSVLLHYMESLYAKFDVDQNWSFSAAELRASYPRFKSFATDFATKTAKDKLDLFATLSATPLLGYGCYSQTDLIRESFIFLVYNGHIPGTTDLNVAPCLGGRSLIDFSGEVNRSSIINTFKILKDVIGS